MKDRGWSWVIVQVCLYVVIILAPRFWNLDLPSPLQSVGLYIIFCAGVMFLILLFNLGWSVTPLPKPKSTGRLVRTGLYQWVRHPMYSSIVIAVLGWGIWSENLFRIILVLVLFVFSDLKSRVEERWLNEIYPEFPEYCKIVKKKFFPEIY